MNIIVKKLITCLSWRISKTNSQPWSVDCPTSTSQVAKGYHSGGLVSGEGALDLLVSSFLCLSLGHAPILSFSVRILHIKFVNISFLSVFFNF